MINQEEALWRESPEVVGLRDSYARQGYKVEHDPRVLSGLPSNYHPDLVLRRGDELIVVEIKVLGSRFDPDQIEFLFDAFKDKKKVKFELVFVDGEKQRTVSISSFKSLREAIIQAKSSFSSGNEVAALLSAWAAFEGAARKRLAQRGEPVWKDMSPLSLLKSLNSYGFIDDDELQELRAVMNIRNRMAHGETDLLVECDLFRTLCHIGNRLINLRMSQFD